MANNLNEMRKLMEAVAPLFENSAESLRDEIYQLFAEQGWSARRVKYETFEEVLGIVSTFDNNLADKFYALPEEIQDKIEKHVIAKLRKGSKIDYDIEGSRGMIGGGLRE